MFKTVCSQQILTELVAELHGDVLKCAFAMNKEIEVLINEIPLIFFLVGNFSEIS